MNYYIMKKINSLIKIEESYLSECCRYFSKRSIRKGGYFIRCGGEANEIAFIEKGLFKNYYIDIEGNESIRSFMKEDDFICSYSSMILGQPSNITIEALENSIVHAISYRNFEKLLAENSIWYVFLKRILDGVIINKEKREMEFLQCDAEARYKAFLARYGSIAKRLRQYQIARYLGVTPISLNRILRKSPTRPNN